MDGYRDELDEQLGEVDWIIPSVLWGWLSEVGAAVGSAVVAVVLDVV